jgi:hypothetical protein
MAFIQPCFIRKNTPELRKRLEELGYKPSYPICQYPEVFKHIAVCNFFGSKYYGVSDDEVSHPGEIKDAIKNRGMIDCGTNEDLFLALAALRDDTDKYQWFYSTGWTDFEGNPLPDKWVFCDQDTLEHFAWVNNSPNSYKTGWKKATVEELIKFYKK